MNDPAKTETPNAAFLSFPDPQQALDTFSSCGIALPPALVVAEVQRSLNTITYEWLNDEGDSALAADHLAHVLWASELDEATTTPLADGWSRVSRLGAVEDIPGLLSRSWSWWEGQREALGEQITTETVTAQAQRAFEEALYDARDLEHVRVFAREVAARLKEHCVDVVIHGSLSDLQRTAYSDLDTWMIVRRETLLDATRLRELKGHILDLVAEAKCFDPLQHHGIFVSSELDLSAYRQARMPLVLLDSATSLLGQPRYEVTLADDGFEKALALFRMARRVRDTSVWPEVPYQLKMLTSWLMLLPVLHHQQHREYAYKPEALAASRGDFSPLAWRAVEVSTRIRESWGEGGEDPVAMAQRLDPELLSASKKLGEEVIEQLYAATVTDAAWDLVDLGSTETSQRIPVTQHPCAYTLDEYRWVERDEVARAAAVPGVRSVWTMGSAANPTLGISDLDLLVLLEGNPATDEVSREAWQRLFEGEQDLGRDPSRRLHAYVKCHPDLVRSSKDAMALRGYWWPAPNRVAGENGPDLTEAVDEGLARDQRTLLMFKEGTFQLLRLMELLQAPRFPLRMGLLRTWTVVHDIRLARQDHDIDDPNLRNFEEVIGNLRKDWFQLEERHRTDLAYECAEAGATLLHAVLVTVAGQLCDEGRVSLDALAPVDTVRQELGPYKLLFSNEDPTDSVARVLTGQSPDLMLPLSVLPMLLHARPRVPTTPALDPEAVARTVDAGFREPSAILRQAVEEDLQLRQIMASNPA